ncbi:regulator of G-protein signaling 20 [Varanus komodoensis]|uniref:Regulator of G protein signaling 20 n=1 Tax=Varanus komodoensis TaxID=61221 RepID=A0A8D2IR06_VARKO|nr:regulator of G-protein signaling 20 [Varanus komodoensis]
MGSEQMEMRKRQTSVSQETPSSIQAPPGIGNRGSNACCFCWCCCCSCSCLTVRNQDERAALHDIGSEPISNGDESSTPTVEEVKAWGKSFEKLMRSTSGRNIFREFLRTEFSEENMLFWLACEDLKKESSDRLIQEKAKRIYEDYVSILSPREVSLDSRARDLVNRNMLEPSQYSFDDAQLQIYTLMYRDSYPRFLSSTFYKNLIDSVSQKSAEA